MLQHGGVDVWSVNIHKEEIVCGDNKGEGSFRNKQERIMFAVQTGIVDSFQLSPSSIRDGVNTVYCLD